MLCRLLLAAGLGLGVGGLTFLGCAGAAGPDAARPTVAVVDLEARPTPSASAAVHAAATASAAASAEDHPGADEGSRAMGEEGTMGAPQGEADGQQAYGMLGLLNTGTPPDGGAMASIFGTGGLGQDAALGAMWGDSIGDSFGSGGLGLTGIGGSGGRGETIGLGSVGSLGHGSGAGTGYGVGGGLGSVGATGKRTGPAKVLAGATSVQGKLPPEVIRRIVRQNFGRFRLCYEKGLMKNPKLAGRIAVNFVIDKHGAIGRVADAGSTLKDPQTKACVLRAFLGLSFPEPEGGGTVVVTYPLVFRPAETAPPAATKSQSATAAPPAGQGTAVPSAPPAPPTSP
jgi:hypothetical protein